MGYLPTGWQNRWLTACAILLVAGTVVLQPAEARRRHSGSSHTSSSRHHGSSSTESKHHGRHHTAHGGSKHAHVVAVKPRYAYSPDIFMMHAPDFDRSELSAEASYKARSAFESGLAENVTPQMLVRSGVFQYHPLRGGIFERREKVKYIIVHSTETGVPQDAPHVIESWSSGGRRHPGAQFVVDRDGTIYEAVDPDLATVHVNIFKTLPGINNDNSVGIEMVHCGGQVYTQEQKLSVTRLVSYLQDRYHVTDEDIITHRYAQQGDHTDPVAFDWEGFLATENAFHNKALAMKSSMPAPEELADVDLPTASVYLEMHKALKPQDVLNRAPLSLMELRQIQDQVRAAQVQVEMAKPAPTTNYLDTSFARPLVTPTANGPRRYPVAAPIRGEIELPPGSASTIDGQ